MQANLTKVSLYPNRLQVEQAFQFNDANTLDDEHDLVFWNNTYCSNAPSDLGCSRCDDEQLRHETRRNDNVTKYNFDFPLHRRSMDHIKGPINEVNVLSRAHDFEILSTRAHNTDSLERTRVISNLETTRKMEEANTIKYLYSESMNSLDNDSDVCFNDNMSLYSAPEIRSLQPNRIGNRLRRYGGTSELHTMRINEERNQPNVDLLRIPNPLDGYTNETHALHTVYGFGKINETDDRVYMCQRARELEERTNDIRDHYTFDYSRSASHVDEYVNDTRSLCSAPEFGSLLSRTIERNDNIQLVRGVSQYGKRRMRCCDRNNLFSSTAANNDKVTMSRGVSVPHFDRKLESSRCRREHYISPSTPNLVSSKSMSANYDHNRSIPFVSDKIRLYHQDQKRQYPMSISNLSKPSNTEYRSKVQHINPHLFPAVESDSPESTEPTYSDQRLYSSEMNRLHNLLRSKELEKLSDSKCFEERSLKKSTLAFSEDFQQSKLSNKIMNLDNLLPHSIHKSITKEKVAEKGTRFSTERQKPETKLAGGSKTSGTKKTKIVVCNGCFRKLRLSAEAQLVCCPICRVLTPVES